MKYFNICSKRTITDSNSDKNPYKKIGFIQIPQSQDGGIWFLELYQNPDTDYFVFPSTGEELPVIR